MSTLRTRFAPSPTGYLHLGSARTALYNWAYARHNGGAFVLRIEDTDRERSTRESEDALIEGMRWLGLDWDEGPYRQSERAGRHDEVVEELLARGDAYRCICTRDELEERKQATLDAGGKWTYDGRCRNQDYGPDCGEHTVRLRLPADGLLGWNDLVFGPSGQDASEVGDKIIRRSDGGALFHLAVVVDDIDMQISHVIRGADHLPNTPFQLALYDAMGATLPEFAHLPLIVGESGKKLSKRRDPVAIEHFREQGFLADGLRNWLVRIGWSHGDQEIFSRQEIIDAFGLEDVGRSSGRADQDKLLWVNHQHILAAPIEQLVEGVSDRLERLLGHPPEGGARLEKAIDLARERGKTLEELAEVCAILMRDEIDLRSEESEKAVKKHLRPAALPLLESFQDRAEALAPEEWDEKRLEEAFEAVCAQHEVKLGKLAQPVRVAVTGGPVSPGIYESLVVIGRDRTLGRLAVAIELVIERAAKGD